MTIIANRYQLQEELGKGAMGTVFKGDDTQTGQTVAIKHLKPDIADTEMIERFRREGEALRDLNHPNIVKMLDTVEENRQHYLIMDYVSGGDLRSVLEKVEQLSVERILNITLDLADALTRAHRLNIIHRDLKPANILMAEDGSPRLTDFGVAHFAEAQPVTETGVAVGTMGYLSPEVLGGNVVDERADIWAFGIILFEMLTKKRPFTGNIAAQVIMATLTESIPDIEELRPDCPIALADLIYRMLEKDLIARIRSIRIIGAELEAILKGYNFEDSNMNISTPNAASGRFDTPLPDYHRAKHNLPIQITPFVGRENELAELAKSLDDAHTRLMTILAPGGMGKTRLSLESASRYIENETFTDGVYFVDLSPLGSFDDQLLSTIHQFVTMLRGGYSVLQCFEYLADNAPEPTASAGRAFVNDVKNGAPQAMQTLRDSVKSKYVGRLVDVMLKQRQEGGNLADRLDEFSDSLKQELGEKRWSDKTQYAQNLIVPAIALAIDYQMQGDDPKSQLLQFLQHRKILLILDNFEHLVSGAGLMTEILTTAPDVKIIATSRIRLNQPAETLFHLSGMDFPTWETPEDALEYAAVRLFQNSAKKAQSAFEVTADNLDYIARICRLVQGMPLGIVLAASWVSTLSLQEIADEIQTSFDILEAEGDSVPDRQQSIRVVFDYTWQTMTATEQNIFMKMSVFHGGFTRQAAQGVTGATLRQLMSLVTKSLIYRNADSGRYTVHELLRQYAAEKLEESGDAETVFDAHMRYYAESLYRRENDIKGALRIPICNDIDDDLENVMAAWKRATKQNNLNRLNQMVDVLYEYALIRWVRKEVKKRIEQAAKQVIADSESRAAYGRLLARASEMQYHIQDYELTEERLQQAEKALEIAREVGNRADEAFVLRSIASYYHENNQHERCLALITEAEKIAEDISNTHILQNILFYRGFVVAVAGRDSEKGAIYWQRSLAIARERDDVLFKAWNLRNLGVVELMRGDIDEHEVITREILTIAKQAGMTNAIPRELDRLGGIYIYRGDFVQAKQYYDEAVALWKDTLPDPMIPRVIECSANARIEFEQGHYEVAYQYELDVWRFWEQRQNQETDYLESNLAALQSLIACGLEDYDKAWSHLPNTFSDGLKRNNPFDLIDGLLAYQCILAHEGDTTRSVEIASLAWNQPACFDNVKKRPLQKTWRESVLQHLSQAEYDAAWEQGKTLDLYATVEAILKELDTDEA